MRRGILQVCLLMGSLPLASAASAQEIVHALAGKVIAVSAQSNTIQVATDDGSQDVFGVLTQKDVPLAFEKSVKALTVPASSFNKANCQVVVFYFGDDQAMTSVALEDLGSSPLTKAVGTVVKLDKRQHLITIKSDSGQLQTFHMDAKTLADCSSGVVEGDKYDPDKGSKVRITATTGNGAPTALFIRTLSL